MIFKIKSLLHKIKSWHHKMVLFGCFPKGIAELYLELEERRKLPESRIKYAKISHTCLKISNGYAVSGDIFAKLYYEFYELNREIFFNYK